MRMPWHPKPMENSRLIDAAQTIASVWHRDEDEQVAALRQRGFSEGEAWRLVNLLPMAFSRPILEELGVNRFSRTVSAFNSEGNEVKAQLRRQPEYVGALRLARTHRADGVMDHEIFKLIAGSSSEIDAASKVLNAGDELRGAAVATVLNGTEVADFLLR